jgi:hypothetical protein
MLTVWAEIDGVGEVFDFGFDRSDSQFSGLNLEDTFTLTGYAANFASTDVGQVLVTEIVIPAWTQNPPLMQSRRDRWVITSIDIGSDEVELRLLEGRIFSRVELVAVPSSTANRYFAWVERKTRYYYGELPSWAPQDGSWVRLLHTVSDLSGSAVPLEGGIATPPSTSVLLAYSAPNPAPAVARLARTRYPFLAYTGNTAIPVSVTWRPETRSAPVLTNDATPSRGVNWPGLICVGPEVAYIREDESAVFRGVLDTLIRGAFKHTVFTAWPSARSSIVRIYRVETDSSSLADAELLFAGRCDDVAMSDDGASLRLSCAGILAVASERRANVPPVFSRNANALGDVGDLGESFAQYIVMGGNYPDTVVHGGIWLEQFIPEFSYRMAIIGEDDSIGEPVDYPVAPALIPERGGRISRRGRREELVLTVGLTPEEIFARDYGGARSAARLELLDGLEKQYAHLFDTAQFNAISTRRMDSLNFLGVPLQRSFASGNTIHAAEALLQALTATGGGHNSFAQSRFLSTNQPADDWPSIYAGNPFFTARGATGGFDIIPAGFGLGIPASLIDIESFLVFAEKNPNTILRDLVFLGEDSKDIFSVIEEKILKPYFLVLTVGRNGLIRLVDMGQWFAQPRGEELALYTIPDILAADNKSIPRATWQISETPPVGSVYLKQKCFYLNPSAENFESGVSIVGVGDDQGFSGEGYFTNAEPTKYEVSLEGPLIDPIVFADRAVAYLRRHRVPRPIITFDVYADMWQSEPGDGVVLVFFPVLPGLNGERELTSLVEVLSVSSKPFDSTTVRVTARVLDTPVTLFLARWAPGLRVEDAPSGSQFEIVNEFIPTGLRGVPFLTDIATALPGMRVELYDEFFRLRTPERPIVTSVSGLTVLLGSSFGVTPQQGDVVMPAPVEFQPDDVRSAWGYYEDGDVNYAVFWG